MNPENPQRPEVSNNYGIGNAPNSSLNHISEVINIKIQSSQALKNIYSPSHKIDITQKSDHSALVSYEGNRSKVMYDFILYYGLDDRDFGINLLTNRVTQDEDGYFMMLLSPKVNIPSYEILAKNLVFVLDVSGSMAGEKIKQAKEALRFCINNLGANDHFNIITFSTEAKLFKKYLVPAAEYKKPALDFINQIEAKGGTNINEALLTALDIKGGKANSQSIVFITDGLPTVGLRDVKEIRKNVKRLNVKNYRIFNFGVGYDVNTQLLDGIAQDNHAVADYIEQNEDIETAISFFYNKIRHPILSTLRLDFGGIEVYDYYPKEVPDLFKGSQLILIGKYKSTGKTKVTLSGQLSNERKSFEYMLNFASLQKENEYLPRLWAARKIGYLLEQIKLNDDGKENRDLIDEIIELSKKFGLVTPYTSYFVNEDENPQFTKLHDHTTQNVLYSFDESALGQAASKANVGKEAIAYSKTTRKLKETEVMDMNKSYNVRYIAGRSFALDKNGYWTDIEFQGAKDLLNIKFGSKAFFQLLKMFPKTKPYLSLTEKVIFKFNGKFIKIDDEGLENITNEKLKKYFSKNH
ncbi:MAG: VWA domain-containing protein [bacterium]